ncbi:PilZN3 domain-containing protein [Treponema primitia]|uniref:PilZN3 domain-containing protein n=1 Tax=Treponema primitia TaxID=88058 RepID=UPI00025557D1|nr:hypothetical protein [Treponema primitia]
MASAATGTANNFLEKYGDRTITCTPYALSKLGVEKNKCFFKIEEYSILCIPFQFGFKRSLFLATITPRELIFFQKYVNTIIGLSISFVPPNRSPAKFLLRCTLNSLGQMKGRENVGLFVADFKTNPEELIILLGGFLETQDRLQVQYEEYGSMLIKMTSPVAKQLGYNLESVISEPGKETRKIQILSLTSKTIEHMEAEGTPVRLPGTPVAYEIILKKARLLLSGTVAAADVLPQGLVRTVSNLSYSPELVEIIDDYWYTIRNPVKIAK